MPTCIRSQHNTSPDCFVFGMMLSTILHFLHSTYCISLQVYKIFSQLAVTAWTSEGSSGSSVADELLIIVRKQVVKVTVSFSHLNDDFVCNSSFPLTDYKP